MTVVDDIKAKIDIVDYISESVPLKKAGRNWSAPCPFHSERTPSFIVSPDRQTWHCFGACNTGGDVLRFAMKKNGVEFGEALRMLAQKAGIALEPVHLSREKAKSHERLKALNRAAALFFHDTLMHTKEAAFVRDYLEKRGVSYDAMEEFRLGYCIDQPGLLEQRLKAAGFLEKELIASGLLKERDDGSIGSFFRGRLMIPIQDERADYIGFGARAMDDSNPKYINTSQTEVFEKGSVLYAIHKARDAIRKEGIGIIVEGYMDALAAHQHGYANVVASMGTALTERQVGALTKLASRFVLALDPDAAGDEATLRSLESSWRIFDRPQAKSQSGPVLTGPAAKQPELRVMNLPRGRDPDEIIREDPEGWKRLVETATPVVDYVFDAIVKRFDPATAQGKTEITKRLAPLIQGSPGVFMQQERVKKLALLLKEDENIIWRAVGGPVSPKGGYRPRKGPAPVSAPYSDPAPKESLEEYCLATLLHFPELRKRAEELTPEHFINPANAEIFKRLIAIKNVEDLQRELDEVLVGHLEALNDFKMPPAYGQREAGLADCVMRLDERKVRFEMALLQGQMSEQTEKEHPDDPEDVQELMRRAEELRQRLAGIHQSRNLPAGRGA
ncbi:MAG: DNA primase [Chloroflexi bacterium]|nr:DNA primase [Chloroflexota bacterium]